MKVKKVLWHILGILWRVLGISIFIVIIFSVDWFASQSLDSIHNADYFKRDISNLIEDGENIDMIILGASQTYHAIDPSIFEQTLGMDNVFVCASANQQISGSYYLLKYLLKYFHPKVVLMGMIWDRLLEYPENIYQKATLLTSDMMTGIDHYIFDFVALEGYSKLNALYMYRFGAEALDYSSVLRKLKVRQNVQNGITQPVKDEYYYYYKGFIYEENSVKTGNMFANKTHVYSNDLIESDSLDYMDKITELCDKNDITLYWSFQPTSVAYLYSVDNYQESVDFYTQYAQEHGTKFFDENLMVDREEWLPDEMMSDSLHTNYLGAEVSSQKFAEILKKELDGEDTSEYFYEDVEAFKADVTRIVGSAIDIVVSDDNIATINVRSLQNDDITPEYRILVAPMTGRDEEGKKVFSEYVEIFPYSSQTEYKADVSGLEDCKFRLEVRSKGSDSYECWRVKRLQKAIELQEEGNESSSSE